MFWRNLFLVLVIFNSDVIFTQIESGKKSNGKKEKIKTEERKINGLTLFLDYNIGKSFRILKSNKTIFGKELGERANESAILTHNYGVGIEQNFSKLLLSFGLSSITYGEKYLETFSDSLLNYVSKYSYFAIPLQLGYKTQGKLSMAFKTGLQIQFLRKFNNTLAYTINGEKIESVDKKSDFINLNSLASITNFRISYQLKNRLAIYGGTSFSFQLNSTYNKQNYYIHKPYLFSGNLGFLIQF
jgi:hypothetical protein